MRIEKRKLSLQEIDLLINDIRKFPDITYVSNYIWKSFGNVYTAYDNNQFIGMCAMIKLKDWIKIGPFVILEKYHGKGYGRELLTHVVNKQKNSNVFVASSNQKVEKILSRHNFIKSRNNLILPGEIIFYGLSYFLKSINLTFLKELLRKKLFFKRGKIYYFIKYK